MTYLLDFLGCKVNSYEVQCVGEELKSHGYTLFDSKKDKYPDVIVINTCAVTETSVSKDRKIIRQYRRKYKDSIILVMGCYAQYNADFIKDELGADIVIGTSNRSKCYELIEKYKKEHKKFTLIDKNNSIKTYESLSLSSMIDNTRAYLKIQDGCDNYCSYCLIPYVRGRSRSRKKEEVLEEIKQLIKNGYKEIVITGIDIGSYSDGKDYHFSDLIEDILINNPDLYRLRISSIEESQIDDKFLELLKNYPNLANHLHMPLQSGSVSVLKKMNRKYNLDNFKEAVRRIRSIRPDISITTDVIVGFPGETDDDFKETLNFCKKVNFSKIHVFPFSRRAGTIADKLPNQVEEIDKKTRVAQLIALSNDLEKKYEKQFYNKELEFLIEGNYASKDLIKGHSSNYLEICVDKKIAIPNDVIKLKFNKSNSSLFFDNVKKLFIR